MDPSTERIVHLATVDGMPWVPPDTSPWFADAVRQAVTEHLTPKQREVVELTYFHGLSQNAIATQLGISQQVVHKRLHGARRGGKLVGGALRRLHAALLPLAQAAHWA